MSIREFIEAMLPWFDPRRERLRDRRTEMLGQRSAEARARADRVIAAYRLADDLADDAGLASRKAGEAMIAEIEKADDR